MTNNPIHQTPVRIYFEDTDAGGIVYNANYLKFMERARTEWLRSLGMNSSDLHKDHALTFVVARIEIAYKRPAFLDDVLMAEAVVNSHTEKRLFLRQNITRDGKVITQATTELAMLDMKTGRGTKIPSDIIASLLS